MISRTAFPVVISLFLLSGGCASTIGSITDRTVMSDHFDPGHDANKLKSMSGDRRQVRVRLTNNGKWITCGEPFAGAIAARGTSSKVTVVERVTAEDGTSQALTKVDERGSVNRLWQDATHRWCVLRAEDIISDDKLIEHQEKLDQWAFNAITPAPK